MSTSNSRIRFITVGVRLTSDEYLKLKRMVRKARHNSISQLLREAVLPVERVSDKPKFVWKA